jgi:chromosome segregation ATPase
VNPASVEALEQARGIFREGATVAVKRIRELRQALKEAEHQLAHAEEQLAQIDDDLKALETEGADSSERSGVHYADSIGSDA